MRKVTYTVELFIEDGEPVEPVEESLKESFAELHDKKMIESWEL